MELALLRRATPALWMALLVVLMAGSALILAGCGEDATDTPATVPEEEVTTTIPGEETWNRFGADGVVAIIDGALGQDPVVIQIGTTVTFANLEPEGSEARYRLVADDGTFDTGELGAQDTFQFTFVEQGEYPFRDELGSGIAGTIFVE